MSKSRGWRTEEAPFGGFEGNILSFLAASSNQERLWEREVFRACLHGKITFVTNVSFYGPKCLM